MTVYVTPSSNGIGAQIALALNEKMILVQRKRFPDGEQYIRIPEKPEGRAIVIQSLYSPQSERLFELLLIIEALSGMGTDNITVVVPYLAYARQDKRFLEGEPISAKVVLRSLEAFGTDLLITVDIHKEDTLKEWLSIPYRNIIPYKEVATYFKNKLENPIVLAPDRGALRRAKLVAGELGAEFDYLVKSRDRVTGEVTALPKEISVKGKDVLIVDDIISTGGTVALATKSVLSRGAKSVYAFCTHAVMVEGALDKLLKVGVKEVVATDTVPSPVSRISVAPSIVEILKI